MQLDNKAFYADLFTKSDTPTPGPGRQLVPAAPVVPVAVVNDETPPALEQAPQSTKSAKAVRTLPAAKEPAGGGEAANPRGRARCCRCGLRQTCNHALRRGSPGR